MPPCEELLFEEPEDPDFLPPRLDAPDEFEIFAARSFDIPFVLKGLILLLVMYSRRLRSYGRSGVLDRIESLANKSTHGSWIRRPSVANNGPPVAAEDERTIRLAEMVELIGDPQLLDAIPEAQQ